MCRAAVRSFLHYVTCIFVLLPDPLPSQHFAIEPFNPCMATPILKLPRIRVYAQTFWSGEKAPQWAEPSIRGFVFPICCFFTFASNISEHDSTKVWLWLFCWGQPELSISTEILNCFYVYSWWFFGMARWYSARRSHQGARALMDANAPGLIVTGPTCQR